MEDESLLNKNPQEVQDYLNELAVAVCIKGDKLEKYEKIAIKQCGSEAYANLKLFVDEVKRSVDKKKLTNTSETNLRYLARQIGVSNDTVDAIVKQLFIQVKTVIVTHVTSTGLDSDFSDVKSFDIDEQPFAGGGHGSLYHCRAINGKPFEHPQVIKIFRDYHGSAANSYKTIRALQDGLIRKKAEFDKFNTDFLTQYPALLAMPQFVFEGELDGVPVKGYSANDLKSYGYINFSYVVEDADLAEKYDNVNLANRFAKAYHMIRAFQLLNEIHYVRSDFKLSDIFVSLENNGGCALIGFENGFVNSNMEEDVGIISFNDMLAPGILSHFKENGHAKVNAFAERWSIAVACFYLLSQVNPFGFLTEWSDTAMSEYNSCYIWPYVEDGFRYFDKEKFGECSEYIKSLCNTLPSGILECFRETFSKGYFNPSWRTSYNQWCDALESQLPYGESRKDLFSSWGWGNFRLDRKKSMNEAKTNIRKSRWD